MAVMDTNQAQIESAKLWDEIKTQEKTLSNQINFIINKINLIQSNEFYIAEADEEDKQYIDNLRAILIATGLVSVN